MATYLRGGASDFGGGQVTDVSFAAVQAAAGDTIFLAYYYRYTPSFPANITTAPTWNGEAFTELVNAANIPGDPQQKLQVFYLTTASSGTYAVTASNDFSAVHAGTYAVYSGVTDVSPIELEEQWFASGYTNPSLSITGTGTVLNVLGASNWADGFADVSGTTWSPANGQTVRQSVQNTASAAGWSILADAESAGSKTVGWAPSANQPAYVHTAIFIGGGGAATPTITDVDGDESVAPSQSYIIQATDDIGATQGTVFWELLDGTQSVQHTITNWDEATDQITVTAVQGNHKFGTGLYRVRVVLGDGTTEIIFDNAGAGLSIEAAANGGYVDVVDPATTNTSSAAYQVEDAGGNPVVTGDQFEWRYTGTISSATFGADTVPTSLDAEGTLEGRFWDATDSTWGAWETLTFSDSVSPSITSVDVPAAGTYLGGQTLAFTANWDEPVDVTGTPALNITIGGQARQANYVSGSGTTALVFEYAIQPGDEGAVSVSSLTLDGGTIQDAAGNNAVLTLNSVGDTSGVLVDGVSPVISINPLTTLDTSPIVSGSAGDATSLTLVVTGVGTYNPVPSGGSWSQQLPTLALGDYPMTLDGVDAAGNNAVQDTATLSVVDELAVSTRLRPFSFSNAIGF